MTKIVYLDTETTGLNPGVHEVWEIAAIEVTPDQPPKEHAWIIRPDLSTADPQALKIGRYWERTEDMGDPWEISIFPRKEFNAPDLVASQLARMLVDAVVIGSNPGFDKEFLTPWLAQHGQPWAAHYRPVDVITLAAGRLMGCLPQDLPTLGYQYPTLPYKTVDISRAFGIDPDDYDRHTALGDCQWAKALYDAITRKEA